MSDDRRYDGLVKSGVRIIEILELFESERRDLKISEIVTALGMPQSSVSMLVKSLLSLGYLVFDPDTRRYRPSEQLAFLGHWALGTPDSVQRLEDVMRKLADDTSESVLLGGQKGLQMQYLTFIESRHHLRFTLNAGQLRPLHGCGLGIMLLSRKTDDEVCRLIRHHNAEFGAPTGLTSENQTLEMVAQAREKGYFETDGIVTPGVGTISTLLPEAVSGRQLGLAIGGPIARLASHRRELRQALLEAANSFSTPQ